MSKKKPKNFVNVVVNVKLIANVHREVSSNDKPASANSTKSIKWLRSAFILIVKYVIVFDYRCGYGYLITPTFFLF